MRIKINSFLQIKEEIAKSNKKIVIYGAGMIGSITTLSILGDIGLTAKVECFVDGDSTKWGTFVSNIPVFSKGKLREIDGNKYVVLIAISRFYDLLEELNGFSNLNDAECYIVPMLCLENFKPSFDFVIERQQGIQRIPKVIHYMWFGKNPIPNTLQRCIDSWKKYCPDYEIRCWNEDNYDIEKIPYMKQAYEKRAYGFVPDYARLDILYQYGGIYLDTDVELVRSLNDLLYQEAFACVEKWQTINFGGGSGAIPHNEMIGQLLEERSKISFIEDNGRLNKTTCGYYDTAFFMRHGYKINGKVQKINGVTIYPYEVFHPYDYMSGIVTQTANTYGIHHFNGGWLDGSQANANRITAENYEKARNNVQK